MKAANASDLHLKSGMRPRYRVLGELRDVEGSSVLTREEVDKLTRELLSEEQDRYYRELGEIDFAYGDVKSGRFRCNYFMEYWGPAAVFRRIPVEIPSLKDLQLPPSLESLIHLRGGIVLVTGPTGSGKTSTLASLLDLINAQYRKHIITLEDPIEYLHPSKKSVVHQRGLHYDLIDFPSGLRAALREDPDIVLIGEMRDLETIRLALTAAEVGSLVAVARGRGLAGAAAPGGHGRPDPGDRGDVRQPGGEQPDPRKQDPGHRQRDPGRKAAGDAHPGRLARRAGDQEAGRSRRGVLVRGEQGVVRAVRRPAPAGGRKQEVGPPSVRLASACLGGGRLL
jgi:energy-coupling factor transporter ATP-binding protein EcfA2